MAFSDRHPQIFQNELGDIRSDGHLQGRAHHLRPAGLGNRGRISRPAAARKRVINMCANNYLGLSSHPDVVEAARKGLDRRGYGMSSVRFICGTQDIHKELERQADRHSWAPRTPSSSPPAWTPTPACSRRVLNEQDVMIADRLVHASIVDGMRLCKAQQRHLQALRHGPPRGKAAAARRRRASS